MLWWKKKSIKPVPYHFLKCGFGGKEKKTQALSGSAAALLGRGCWPGRGGGGHGAGSPGSGCPEAPSDGGGRRGGPFPAPPQPGASRLGNTDRGVPGPSGAARARRGGSFPPGGFLPGGFPGASGRPFLYARRRSASRRGSVLPFPFSPLLRGLPQGPSPKVPQGVRPPPSGGPRPLPTAGAVTRVNTPGTVISR